MVIVEVLRQPVDLAVLKRVLAARGLAKRVHDLLRLYRQERHAAQRRCGGRLWQAKRLEEGLFVLHALVAFSVLSALLVRLVDRLGLVGRSAGLVLAVLVGRGVAFFGGSLVVPCLLVSVVCIVGVIRNVSFRRGNCNAILTLSDGYHEPRLGAECLSRRNGPYAVRIPGHEALVALGAYRLDLARKPDCVQDVSKGGLIADRKLKAQVVVAKLHHVPG